MKIQKKWIIFLVLSLIGASFFPAISNAEETKATSLEFNQIDDQLIKISIKDPIIEFDNKQINRESFLTLTIENEDFLNEYGCAKLPVLRRMIEIPYGAEPEFDIVFTKWESTRVEERIIPAQPPIVKLKSREETKFILNEEYYQTNKFMPYELIKTVETGEIRGHQFAIIEISPVKYNPILGELKILQSCEINVNLIGGDIRKTDEQKLRYDSPAFDDLSSKLMVNYGSIGKDFGESKDPEGYLIIVYDNFYDEILPLASWKQSLGFDVTVTNTSQIPGGVTTTNIYNYILDAYTNWPIPPTYILLVGDTPQIPTYYGSVGGTAADLYYVTMDGDMFPDIFIGRFPADQESHVTAMVDKTIYYEQGNFDSIDWIKKAAFMAGNDNYQISEGTHNYVISTYLEPNGYTCDKIYEVSYGAVTQDVTDALNDGRSLAIFSGHGSTTSWADGPTFTQNNVRSLTNQDIYPFVCSHACVTGTFTYSECFGETWLREANKAGLAFWGSSHNTYWDPDDVLEKEMFEAWWEDNLEEIGAMTDMALYEHYLYQSGGFYGQLYFECYNILGDPSVKVWRDEPNPEVSVLVSNLQSNWNFASLPFNMSVPKNDLIIKYNGMDYTWAEATNPTNGPIISSTVFGWDSISQSYVFADILEPGMGYWIFSYYDCELWADNITIIEDGYITMLNDDWNLVGSPRLDALSIDDLIITFDGDDYTWSEATSAINGPIISSTVFGWDSISQSYVFADTLEPGKGYWVYSYENCKISVN